MANWIDPYPDASAAAPTRKNVHPETLKRSVSPGGTGYLPDSPFTESMNQPLLALQFHGSHSVTSRGM